MNIKLVSLLAGALALTGFQQPTPAWLNPTGVPVQAYQFAAFDASGSGSVIDVELIDSMGLTAPLTDANHVSWPSARLTIAASSAEGIGYGITLYAPDGTHTLNAPTVGQTLLVRVVSGSVTLNASGTYDCSSGAAGGSSNGIMPGRVAPNANSPILMNAGDIYVLPLRRP